MRDLLRWLGRSLVRQIIIAMLLGIIIGRILMQTGTPQPDGTYIVPAAEYFQILGEFFTKALRAVAPILVFILIGTAGAPPAAAAPSPSDVKMTAAYQIDIHENETVDVTVTMEVEGSSPSSYCTKDLTDSMKFEDQPDVTVDVETKDNQCIMTFTGIKIANMNDDASMSIEHKDNKYFFSASDFFEIKDIDSTMSVTFPGKVTKADDNAKVSGNTAT